MKTRILLILTAFPLFFGCSKDCKPVKAPCIPQFANPSGKSYACSEFTEVTYTTDHCGMLPFSSNTSWVYEDSLFDDEGNFIKKQLDTLAFEKKFQASTDTLIWWEPNKFIGIAERSYSNDSNVYRLSRRNFATPCLLDAKKDFFYPTGESQQYLANFEDDAAIGTATRIQEYHTAFADYTDCISFEKLSPFYRHDIVVVKPGIGVIKFIHRIAPLGQPDILYKQVSTLVHIYQK